MGLIDRNHSVGGAESAPLEKEQSAIKHPPGGTPFRDVHLGTQIMVIEHKPHAEQAEQASQGEECVWRIAGMYGLKWPMVVGFQCQPKRSEPAVRKLDEV